MIRGVGPREAEALIAAGDLDVVDVREASEWATGHVPGARHVPLGSFRADPGAAALGEKVLFVCEKGGRSMSAAELAESRGVAELYSLDGGTAAWRELGLAVVVPAPPPPRAATAATAETEAAPPEEAHVAPELDAIVGANVRELRAARGYSLDTLAGLSGVGRQTLGQIELGRTVPSLGTLWKIAKAFDVPFAVLLVEPTTEGARVLRASSARRLVGADGRFSSRALFSPEQKGKVEFYELWLAGHGREDAEAHAPGTRENLVVTSGRLVVELGTERFELAKGDALVFVADAPHAYINPGSEECWMNLVMTYRA
jgi:rhodanese-related sulfurtransferase/transcriptional regulator with XRE-family HTH domain